MGFDRVDGDVYISEDKSGPSYPYAIDIKCSEDDSYLVNYIDPVIKDSGLLGSLRAGYTSVD